VGVRPPLPAPVIKPISGLSQSRLNYEFLPLALPRNNNSHAGKAVNCVMSLEPNFVRGLLVHPTYGLIVMV
jgi:hypothetical protein